MEKIRVGIIGVGNMACGHTDNILAGRTPDFELTAVADIDPERLKSFEAKYNCSARLFGSADEMLDSGLVDACMVCVPHYSHPGIAMEAMKRGIHVMVEKPAGVYTRQVREMNECAAVHPEVVFGMMFNQRTNCVYRKMKEIIDSGRYGRIRRTNWIITNWYRPQAYYDSGAWRATWSGEGGGVLLNQCPHQLDLWQWICGMPSRIEAHLGYGKWHDIEVEDDVTAYAEYPGGATGVFVTTTGDACGTNRFEVQLDGAKLVVENDVLTLYEFEMPEPEFTRTNREVFGHMRITSSIPETDGKNEQHVGVVNAWGGAILRGTPLVARGEEGINGLMISNAMHLSSFLGRPVDLPVDEDLYYEELMKRVAVSRRKDGVKTAVADTKGSYSGT
ncbi:MAG: Gfo/Idh/MocA family oxidoreductase [Clostridia bacterium]|nr:Gfo/Idh/MocA family oxidoreductase [Clostridia bacterium]